MRINELTRKSVIFLGIRDLSGEFVPYGTGFFVMWLHDELLFVYIVTARHVLESMKATKRPLVARINGNQGTALVGDIDADHWVFHLTESKCDIAVTHFTGSTDDFDMRAIILNGSNNNPSGVLDSSYIDQNDIGCGDEIFTVGLLVSHFGTAKNVPIVRTGNIAGMPEELVDLGGALGHQEVYLVESRSIGGLSGSPVFLHTPPFRHVHGQVKDMGGHQREYLLGVNIGLFSTRAHADTIPNDTIEKREAFLETMSSGIAIVVPIQRVIEIVGSKDFAAGRDAASKAHVKALAASAAKQGI